MASTQAPKAPITRTKTGCLTCRRRRKKCDERKPTCSNCERNAYRCEGYEAGITWIGGERRARNHQKRLRQSCAASWQLSNSRPENEVLDEPLLRLGLSSDTGQGTLSWCNDEQDLFLDPLDPDQNMSGSNNQVPPVGKDVVTQSADADIWSFSLEPMSSLPPLIEGVHDPIEHRLFQHFITSVGPCLVLQQPGGQTTFTETIMALAMSSSAIMKTIFSISASHLAQNIESGNPLDTHEPLQIRQAGFGFYGAALMAQQQLSMSLLESIEQGETEECRTAFTVAMLLTQYDTCEGGKTGIWKTHLNLAKRLSRKYMAVWAQGTLRDFVDWYSYHDTLSRVTEIPDPSSPESVSSDRETDEISSITYESTKSPILIGPRDGLFDLLDRIIDLRHFSQQQPYYAGQRSCVILKGMQIGSELQHWICPYMGEQSKIVAECYRWAEYLMLYSTIHPVSLKDSKVQAALDGGLDWLQRVSPVDNEQTCSLFPTFVFGIAALCEKQRDHVRNSSENYWR